VIGSIGRGEVSLATLPRHDKLLKRQFSRLMQITRGAYSMLRYAFRFTGLSGSAIGLTLVWSMPLHAQQPSEALTCFTTEMSPDLNSALLKTAGSTLSPAENAALNARGGACRKQFNWSFSKTVEALSFAGFHLRARAERDKLRARNVSQATIADIESAAEVFHTYNLQQDETGPFDRWLANKGWGPMSAFRRSAYFPLFNELAGSKVASARYAATP
jgi:hypothetical protein